MATEHLSSHLCHPPPTPFRLRVRVMTQWFLRPSPLYPPRRWRPLAAESRPGPTSRASSGGRGGPWLRCGRVGSNCTRLPYPCSPLPMIQDVLGASLPSPPHPEPPHLPHPSAGLLPRAVLRDDSIGGRPSGILTQGVDGMVGRASTAAIHLIVLCL